MKLLNDYDAFIKGKMTEDEADVFTRKILKEHFNDETRKEHWTAILKEKRRIQKEEKTTRNTIAKPNKLRLLFSGLAIAASVLFLIFSINQKQQQNIHPTKLLVSQYLESPFPYNGARKGANTISEKRLEAGNLYAKKSYTESIKTYHKIISANEGTPEDFLYLGLNHLYLNQANEAIQFFKKNVISADGSFQKESTWFLSLAYLQKEDFENAKIHLQQILNWEDPQNNRVWEIKLIKQAKTLLQSLE